MKVGDLVRNVHALYPAGIGIIIEVSTPQLKNPNACPYKVHWFDYGYSDDLLWTSRSLRSGRALEPCWMRGNWIEKIYATG